MSHPPGDYRCVLTLADGREFTYSGPATDEVDAIDKTPQPHGKAVARMCLLRWHQSHKRYRRLSGKRLLLQIGRRFGARAIRGDDGFGGTCIRLVPKDSADEPAPPPRSFSA